MEDVHPANHPRGTAPLWPQRSRLEGTLSGALAPEEYVWSIKDNICNHPIEHHPQRPIPHVSLFEQLLTEKVLEWSYIRSEIWQREWCGGRLRAEGAVHLTRQESVRGERAWPGGE